MNFRSALEAMNTDPEKSWEDKIGELHSGETLDLSPNMFVKRGSGYPHSFWLFDRRVRERSVTASKLTDFMQFVDHALKYDQLPPAGKREF